MAVGSVLGGELGAKGVVVDAPVRVDGGLVACQWGSRDTGNEFGLAGRRGADVAGFPGLEINGGDGQGGIGAHGKRGHGGEGLGFVSDAYMLVYLLSLPWRSAFWSKIVSLL